jgi:adenylosuccinate synthase
MLSVDWGSYPYVTASDCTVDGLAKGAGLSARDVDYSLGVVKAFYMTRVGDGPFPTEIDGELGEEIRREGDEYGATTGRPRRVGWLDLPLLRYAKQFSGRKVALTKIDVLGNQPTIMICSGYRYTGPDYNFAGRLLQDGDILSIAIPQAEVMKHCQPVYMEFPGWNCDISGAKNWSDLPKAVLSLIYFIREAADVEVVMVSVGKDREQTIFRP